MRVHPLSLKPNIGEINSNFLEQQQHIPDATMNKFRRLPHVFNDFLDSQFSSDADVVVEEKEGFFYFMVKIKLEGYGDGQVGEHAEEIHPTVTKIIVRKGNDDGDEDEQLNVDTWRYTLRGSAMPEMDATVFIDEKYIVTVSKDDLGRGEFDHGSRGVWRDADQLVLVQ